MNGTMLAETHMGVVGTKDAVAAFVGGDEVCRPPSGPAKSAGERRMDAVDGPAKERPPPAAGSSTTNEDDVRAAASVRRWLRSAAFPAVEDLDGGVTERG